MEMASPGLMEIAVEDDDLAPVRAPFSDKEETPEARGLDPGRDHERLKQTALNAVNGRSVDE